MTRTTQTQAEFRRLVHRCIELAQALYDVDFGRVTITFDLKGETAAYALQVPHPNLGWVYKLRFNREAIRLDWDHMVNSTIPHEVAHLVAFACPQLRAENHDHHWKQIAINLGDISRGATHHTIPLKPARRLRRFLYRNESGAQVAVSPRLHRQVQTGECGGIVYARQEFSANHFERMTIGG